MAKSQVLERLGPARRFVSQAGKAAPRGLVSEWAMTFLIYLFASTTLVQAYVIPTGSMEGNQIGRASCRERV